MSPNDLGIIVRGMRRPLLDREATESVLDDLFDDSVHAKRVASMAGAVVGVMNAAVASIHAIGAGLAVASGLDPRHATKQVDRLLSNEAMDVWSYFDPWVRYVVGLRFDLVVALDWTEFDADGQATVAVHLVNSHGRTTPLVWKTVEKKALKGRRASYEYEVLARLREIVPAPRQVLVLADRGFADRKLFEFMREKGLDYIVRIRAETLVSGAEGEQRRASEWVPANGRARKLERALVTSDKYELGAFVAVKARGMEAAWLLAVSDPTLSATRVVELYAKRFTIEETFRDIKDPRFGFGIEQTRLGEPARRDRLLLLAAMAMRLLTILGEAGERAGLDRMLKTNSTKRRTLSLLRQGRMLYDLIPKMKEERMARLLEEYVKLLELEALWAHAFGRLE